MDARRMRRAKQLGLSDPQLAKLLISSADAAVPTLSEDDVRRARLGFKITPFVKQIDTLAAEYPAQTNYLYMTYHGAEHDVPGGSKSRVVLGSGSYRIGSSVEFDWCGVSTIRSLRKVTLVC
ncbi:unnamed protein product [Sphagnum jensenii]|uniref:Carbamoyl-phosphate synthetase large subunit oligomerisation domain-containing protein n=1 Tax=Sphagnum jensenii TaxID=128206 RepID=A0ABP0VDD9_9BRYO